jgi:pimeloyl-ACP methyl ester carboxylesterase
VSKSAETDFRADVEKIRVPTLVIHGDKDASNPLPLTGKRTAALVPGAKLVVYEGAPHGLPLTHTQQLNEDLMRFLRA